MTKVWAPNLGPCPFLLPVMFFWGVLLTVAEAPVAPFGTSRVSYPSILKVSILVPLMGFKYGQLFISWYVMAI